MNTPNETADYTIVYDTLCGWSYGASNVLQAVIDSGATVRLLHRYLFEGDNALVLSEGKADQMAVADARISELTGQPFRAAYVKNVREATSEVLDSGMTADAASLVRDQGAAQEFALSRRLQERRFVDGVSGQNRDDVIAVLGEFGIDRAEADRIGGSELRAEAIAMSEQARAAMAEAGAVGVPALIAHHEDRDELIDIGRFYQRPTSVTRVRTVSP